MIFEGVNFNEEEIRKMEQDKFESMHIDLFWQNRDEATRKKMLGQVYELVNKPARKSKQKSVK